MNVKNNRFVVTRLRTFVHLLSEIETLQLEKCMGRAYNVQKYMKYLIWNTCHNI